MKLVKLILLSGIVLVNGIAFAGEGALYAEDAPPGSAFVRVFNGAANAPLTGVDLGGKVIESVTPLNASPYVYLPPGSYTLQVNGKQKQVDMQAEEFYTLVWGENFELTLIKDTNFTNRRKALVSLYNLLPDKNLDLKTVNSQVPVIESVNFLGSKDREVNAVKITLQITAGDKALGQADTVNLQRGLVFSLFACGDSSSPRFVWVESKVDTSI